jgi:hypothetical protein
MSRTSRRAVRGVMGMTILWLQSSRKRLINNLELSGAMNLIMIGFMVLILAGQSLANDELNPDKFRRMVQTELERTQVGTDSVGTILKVRAFGGQARDFMLAPVIRNGKLVAVYKNDPRRNSVTPLASAAVLKSVSLDLFSEMGARQVLQDRGYTSGSPIAVSVGPCSLFGVLETGWYLSVGESFVLLSFEGRIATESDVTHFWSGKLVPLKQIRELLQPKSDQ